MSAERINYMKSNKKAMFKWSLGLANVIFCVNVSLTPCNMSIRLFATALLRATPRQ